MAERQCVCCGKDMQEERYLCTECENYLAVDEICKRCGNLSCKLYASNVLKKQKLRECKEKAERNKNEQNGTDDRHM